MAAETYHVVAEIGEIPENSAISVEISGRMIAVFRDEGQYFALDDCCPHQGMPLSDGSICDKVVTCAWHGWRFSLENGRWLDSPRTGVTTYPVRVVEGRIEVGVED